MGADEADNTGLIFNIQRHSTEDGPGKPPTQRSFSRRTGN
jgi:hypothetical protein